MNFVSICCLVKLCALLFFICFVVGVEIYFMEFYGSPNDKWTERVSTLVIYSDCHVVLINLLCQVLSLVVCFILFKSINFIPREDETETLSVALKHFSSNARKDKYLKSTSLFILLLNSKNKLSPPFYNYELSFIKRESATR